MAVLAQDMQTNLDIASLRTFVLIAQGRTFTETAVAVGRSQPAVSLQIRALERDVGDTVFLRKGGRAVLTAAGERLFAHAQRILHLNDEVVGSTGPGRRGSIGFGVTSSLASHLLPPVLERFMARHPDVDVTIRIGTTSDVIAALLHREIDVAVGVDRDDPLRRESLLEASMIWAGRSDFEWPSDGILPLALGDGQCELRMAALRSLRDRHRYRIAASGRGPVGLLASVGAGFSVTPAIRLALSPPLVDVGAELRLPALPVLRYALYGQATVRCDVQEALVCDLKDLCGALQPAASCPALSRASSWRALP